MKNSVFKILFRKNIVLFVLEILSAYAVTEVLLLGNSRISEAIDIMLEGNARAYINGEFWVYMAGLVALGFLFSMVQNICTKRFAINIMTGFRRESGGKLFALEYRYYDTHTSAQVLNYFISDAQKVSEYYAEVLPWIVTAVISVGTVLFSIAAVDIVLTLSLLLVVPVLTFISRYVDRKIIGLTRMHQQLWDEVNEMAFDGLQGMNVVRSFNLESEMLRRIRGANDKLLKYEYRRNRISGISWILGDAVGIAPGILLGFVALLRVRAGYITPGEMAYFLLLLDRIVNLLSQLPGVLIEAKEALVSRERLDKIMSFPTEHGGDSDFDTHGDIAIEFKKVDFAYEEGADVLKDFNVRIRRGENVAFVGESGGGKSTIFKLICGLYQPSGGSIYVWGKDTAKSDVCALREHLATVSQDSFLFPESIEWNVRCGDGSISREEVMEACRKACIHDFIMSLPEGYDTNVGERGDLLSGGQKQRLSIARALLKNAEIILFDEPTASVDVENENQIKEALQEAARGKTVITIAHRLNTIRDADCIFVLDGGKIVERGTHEELLAQSGRYYRLYAAGEDSRKEKPDE